MSYRFEVAAGASKKLLVGGKYCEEDIIVTALGGSDAPDVPDEPVTPEYSEGLEIVNSTVYGIGTCTDDIIVIPEEHQGLPVTTLYGPYSGSFKQIIMPDSMEYIEHGICECPNLERVEFGSGLESINYWCFNNNPKCKEYDFTRCTHVPMLHFYFDEMTEGYSFEGMPSDCKMIVPDALLDEWSQATNWTLYATHITSPSSANTEKKSVMYKQNGTYEVLPSEGKLLRKVTVFVNISSESQGLEYHNYWENGVYVSGYGDWDGEHLVIPSEYTDWSGTYPVTGIDWGALNDNSKIRSVTLPSSLTWLKGVDFYNCPKLTHVYMPAVSMIDSICMGGESFEYVQFRDMGIIGGNVFTGCKYCVFDFTDCSAIPTLDSYGAASEFGTNPIIRVPASLLDEWRSATNWTLYADYIVAGA